MNAAARRRSCAALLFLLLACHEPTWPTIAPPPAALVGRWSAVQAAPIVQLHLHLLLDGKVLSWGRKGVPQVWDPATGAFSSVPSPSLLFCAGHDFLSDGRLFVAGGHIKDLHGLPNTNVFDPATETWQALPPMAAGRWYPTNTTLPDGRILTLAGTDTAGVDVPIPEVWDGTAWHQLTTAPLVLPLYPRAFVAPDGRIFVAGEQPQTYWLDVTGTGQWTDGPVRQFGSRGYGSAVMYEPGKILYVGGGDPPTNTAEIINLNQTNPTWRYTGSMAYARRQMNATLLPTGDVLVTGGTYAGGFSDPSGAVRPAEVWSPATGQWTQLASNAVTRVYHGATLLLPDGRILHTGSGDASGVKDELNYEVYSPPYLFSGPRPTITGAVPGSVTYGQTVVVTTPDAATIINVNLIRFSSVTHAFNQSQRLVPLSFSKVTGGISVSFPTSRTAAPPGPYLLFLVSGAGVPSLGKILLLR